MIEKKLLKLQAEGQEFTKNLRSLKQFIQTVKGQTVFETECFFNLFFRSNTASEEFKFKLEKIIGFEKPTGNVRKEIFS